MTSALTDSDRDQIREHGLAEAEVERQLALLRRGPRAMRLERPCTVGDGIDRIDAESDHGRRLIERYEQANASGRFSKLVPASGAATRMFRSLLEARSGAGDESARADARRLLHELPRLPFFAQLEAEIKRQNGDLAAILARPEPTDAEIEQVLATLLDEDGLAYATAPKALIPFHTDPDGDTRTALEEHLREGTEHLIDSDRACRMHFTIPQHQEMAIRDHLRSIVGEVEQQSNASLLLSWSIQSPETDTVALADDGQPFRQADGSLLFRPGGHGALLHNLELLGGDLVLVRNIDNIQPAWRRDLVVLWNRLLGGYLLDVEQTVDNLLQALDEAEASNTPVDGPPLDRAVDIVRRAFGDQLASSIAELEDAPRRQQLRHFLDRPLRVCGMVPFDGDTGGGPFWVRADDGSESPQIVESAQIDRQDARQAAIADSSSHFNPVHIVARLRDRHGEPYPLGDFVDADAVFLSDKSLDGRPLVALERPGLWNGAMARWLTFFVEVPPDVFAPVKTVFDLLDAEHQPAPEKLAEPDHTLR